MITLGELTALAERDGVDAKTVERDYIICHVMASIAESRAGEILQFKGGTGDTPLPRTELPILSRHRSERPRGS